MNFTPVTLDGSSLDEELSLEEDSSTLSFSDETSDFSLFLKEESGEDASEEGAGAISVFAQDILPSNDKIETSNICFFFIGVPLECLK